MSVVSTPVSLNAGMFLSTKKLLTTESETLPARSVARTVSVLGPSVVAVKLTVQGDWPKGFSHWPAGVSFKRYSTDAIPEPSSVTLPNRLASAVVIAPPSDGFETATTGLTLSYMTVLTSSVVLPAASVATTRYSFVPFTVEVSVKDQFLVVALTFVTDNVTTVPFRVPVIDVIPFGSEAVPEMEYPALRYTVSVEPIAVSVKTGAPESTKTSESRVTGPY